MAGGACGVCAVCSPGLAPPHGAGPAPPAPHPRPARRGSLAEGCSPCLSLSILSRSPSRRSAQRSPLSPQGQPRDTATPSWECRGRCPGSASSAGHMGESTAEHMSHAEGRAQHHCAPSRERRVASVVTTQLHRWVPSPARLSHRLCLRRRFPPRVGNLCRCSRITDTLTITPRKSDRVLEERMGSSVGATEAPPAGPQPPGAVSPPALWAWRLVVCPRGYMLGGWRGAAWDAHRGSRCCDWALGWQ